MQHDTKWTPGPWVIYPETDGTVICAVDMVEKLPIRQPIANPIIGQNWIKNAHLIAAAPELYDALSTLERWLTEESDCRTQEQRTAGRKALISARAALAKARDAA